MKIGLLDVDGKNFPNLALMKIKTFYGEKAQFYNPFEHYDIVYQTKVFTFTSDYPYKINTDSIIKGGTGYNLNMNLFCDNEIPDLTLYQNHKFYNPLLSYGFLTRGCPNKCSWCIVPQKEGNIKPYRDIEEVAQNKKHIILMDNNILACNYGIDQLEKIIKLNYRVDFNQGLDARLVTPEIAQILSKIKWLREIRFGCDTQQQVNDCEKAIKLINKYNPKARFLLYTIIHGEIEECYQRTKYFKNYKNVIIHAQPLQNFKNHNYNIIPQWQKDMARWSNRRELYKTCDFKDFQPRKNFKCKQYFN